MAEATKKESKGAIGALIGTVVLAAVCAVGGWVARELVPAEKPAAA